MSSKKNTLDARIRNRTSFAEEMAARTRSGQRLGLFSSALPLTVGDASTDYQKERRPAEEIGRLRAFSVARGKQVTAETFEKIKSNAIGDEYVDPGQYFLRKGNSVTPAPFKAGGA